MLRNKLSVFLFTAMFSLPLLGLSANAAVLTVPNNSNQQQQNNYGNYQQNPNQRYNNRNNRSINHGSREIVRTRVIEYRRVPPPRFEPPHRHYDHHYRYERRNNSGLTIEINPFPTIQIKRRRY